MSERTAVPGSVLRCDRCNGEGGYARPGPFLNGGLHAYRVERWVRGYDGAAGGSVDKRLDLCYSCALAFDAFMKMQSVPAERSLDGPYAGTGPEEPSQVAGEYMNRSLADFRRACERLIRDEAENPNGDTWLIATLCDAVRLSREHERAMTRPIGVPNE